MRHETAIGWTIEDAARGRRSMASLSSVGDRLYWVESRPEDGGRQVVVSCRPGHRPTDVTPADQSVRSRVHEYGGGAYCLVPSDGTDPTVAFVSQSDQQVHMCLPGKGAVRLRGVDDKEGDWRYGDLHAAPNGKWICAVRESADPQHPDRALVALAVTPNVAGSVLLEDSDFLVAPRVNHQGSCLAWVAWDHPDMSWDASEVWTGSWVEDAGSVRIEDHERVAGGRNESAGISVGQPTWMRTGGLLYISDEGGWWRPWLFEHGKHRRLSDEEAEFHGPDWGLGQTTMVPRTDGTILLRRRKDGFDDIGVLDMAGEWRSLAQPCVSVSSICQLGDKAAWMGSTAETAPAPWIEGPEPVTESRMLGPNDAGGLSRARHFSCPSGEEGRAVHGLFFEPHPAKALMDPPPLVVFCHGGPTGSTDAGFDPIVHLLTSRGLAVAAVDYAGSTGYGTKYRRSLDGRWGEVDADDCSAAARWLADRGWVDGARMAIRGSSAGGFTALCALVRSDVWAGAVSWYGVTDLETLVATTHDFESRYVDRLVGPLPEAIAEYRRRSPAHRAADMTGAVLLLQGTDDPVVPESQATALRDALEQRGVPCTYRRFEGEGHGFRRFDTLVAALGAELAFYEELFEAPR